MESPKVCEIYHWRRRHCVLSFCLPPAVPRASAELFTERAGFDLAIITFALGKTERNHVEQLLRDLDAQWAKAAAAKDVEQTIGYYSDDAIVLPPNATGAATKEAIRNVWKDMFASPSLVISWQPTRVQVGKSGEMAWVRGSTN